MAKLPQYTRITPENFPKEPWVDRLLTPLNSVLESVTSAFNKNLTFNENVAGSTLTVLIDGTFPVKMLWTNKQRPTAAWIGQVREVSGVHTTLTVAPYLDWEINQAGQFQVNNITGLSASAANKFYVTVIAVIG